MQLITYLFLCPRCIFMSRMNLRNVCYILYSLTYSYVQDEDLCPGYAKDEDLSPGSIY